MRKKLGRKKPAPQRRSASARINAFVDAYFAHGMVGSKAAVALGAAPGAAANKLAGLMLRKPQVARMVEQRAKELTAPFKVTAEKVVELAGQLAFGDRSALVDDNWKLLPKKKLTKEQLLMIEGIERDKKGRVIAKVPKRGPYVDMLMKHFGLYAKDNAQRQVDPDEMAARVRAKLASIEESTGKKE